MKKTFAFAALAAAIIAAPASAAQIGEGIPFCKKNPAACEAACIVQPWRLFCR